mmetsp:Transcript_12320/g.16923  ORF Transcript_12320/g.16923 Transcript_12320/m.16923 type:complete len:799 (+) Transcript_12320:68-2464(+)
MPKDEHPSSGSRKYLTLVCGIFIFFYIYESGADLFLMGNQESSTSRILSSGGSSSDTTATTTDCTSKNTSETGEALFANLLRVHNPGFLIVAVIITVVIVTIVENTFLLLLKLTDDTPYSEMIIVIERELMNVGFSALLFKVVCNNTHFLDHDWFFALELSDVLVPFYVFCSCTVGIAMVLTAMRQCFIWSKAYHLQLNEILDEYQQIKNKTFLVEFAPFSKIMNQLEFRIYNLLFCETHHINRSVHFDEYVAIVMEKFILSLIEIRPADWVILICVLILIMTMSSWTDNAAFYGDHCSSDDLPCMNLKAVQLFSIFGAILFAVSCCLAAVTRKYELLFLQQRGVNSATEYMDFLQAEERLQLNRAKTEKSLGEDDLMAVLVALKDRKGAQNTQKHHTIGYYLQMYPSMLMHSFYSLLTTDSQVRPDAVEDIRKLEAELSSNKTTPKMFTTRAGHAIRKSFSDVEHHVPSLEDAAETSRKKVEHNREVGVDNTCISTEDNITDLESNQHCVENLSTDINSEVAQSSPATVKGFSHSKSVAAALHHARSASNFSQHKRSSHDNLSLDQKEDIVQHTEANIEVFLEKKQVLLRVFFLSNPTLYFEIVKFLLMVISAYNALWLINFISISQGIWKLVTILPGVFSAMMFSYTVKIAALLKGIAVIDNDALLEVLEQTEHARQLGDEIRDKLLTKLSVGGDPISTLYNLFKEIDDDGSNKLSRLEFEDLLHEFNLSFSRKKMRQIFHEIDRNFDDSISFHEFFIFLFPDHDIAKQIERDRLEVIAQRVNARMTPNPPPQNKV